MNSIEIITVQWNSRFLLPLTLLLIYLRKSDLKDYFWYSIQII